MSRAYAQKVKISNLQQMAETVLYIQEHGYDSRAELQETSDDVDHKLEAAKDRQKKIFEEIRDVNEQIHFTGQYYENKDIFAQMPGAKNKKKFRDEHSDEIRKYEEARSWMKEKYPDGKMHSMKTLKVQKEKLQSP